VNNREALRQALVEELARREPAVVVAKVTQLPPVAAPLPPYTGLQIRDRFLNALRDSHVISRRQVA
jgi:hypothetical protein